MAAWCITFLFVHIAWIFFRAPNMGDALNVILAMVDIASILDTNPLSADASDLSWGGATLDPLINRVPTELIANLPQICTLLLGFAILSLKNSIQISKYKIGNGKIFFAAFIFAVSIYTSLANTSSVFLYFNF